MSTLPQTRTCPLTDCKVFLLLVFTQSFLDFLLFNKACRNSNLVQSLLVQGAEHISCLCINLLKSKINYCIGTCCLLDNVLVLAGH